MENRGSVRPAPLPAHKKVGKKNNQEGEYGEGGAISIGKVNSRGGVGGGGKRRKNHPEVLCRFLSKKGGMG